eukprot:GHVS01027541.1.p1 GENE.GHVS01027541.1~~GHVS01027541.1.p1  ORF type:complete len:226 (-),score=25.23 GHVS01027541.1:146-823(-)
MRSVGVVYRECTYSVAHKGLPFFYLPNLEARWKENKQPDKFVYHRDESWKVSSVDVTGLTIKVYDSTDRKSFDVEEQTWATIIEAVDKDYLISESSQDLSKRTAVDMPTVPPLLNKIIRHFILPAFAVSTFSYDDTAAGATTTKFCFVKPYSPSLPAYELPLSSPQLGECDKRGESSGASIMWLVSIPGVRNYSTTLKGASYLEYHREPRMCYLLLDDWRMQQFP